MRQPNWKNIPSVTALQRYSSETGNHICDPTYIGAPVGMAMPECKTQEVKVVEL